MEELYISAFTLCAQNNHIKPHIGEWKKQTKKHSIVHLQLTVTSHCQHLS